MSGSLRHLGGDRWKVTVYAGLTPEGKQRNKSKTFRAPNRRAAEKAVHGHIDQLQKSIKAEAERKGTIAELADEWLRLKARECSPTTMGPYRQIARAIVEQFGRLPVRDLTGRQIDLWYGKLRDDGMSVATLSHWHAVMRAMLRQARQWEMVDQVATERTTKLRATTKDVQPPTAAAVQMLLDQAPGEVRALLRVKAATGARRGEICGLRWTDVLGDQIAVQRAVIEPPGGGLQVKAPKTRQSVRAVRVDRDTLIELAAHRGRIEEQARQLGVELAEDAFMFPDLQRDPTGRHPRAPSWVSRQWARLRGDAPIRLHDLRHWHATQLLSAGVSAPTVARRLGHSKVTTTLNVYAHALEQDDERSAEHIGSLLALPPA